MHSSLSVKGKKSHSVYHLFGTMSFSFFSSHIVYNGIENNCMYIGYMIGRLENVTVVDMRKNKACTEEVIV